MYRVYGSQAVKIQAGTHGGGVAVHLHGQEDADGYQAQVDSRKERVQDCRGKLGVERSGSDLVKALVTRLPLDSVQAEGGGLYGVEQVSSQG